MFCPTGQAFRRTTNSTITLSAYDAENGILQVSAINGDGESSISFNGGDLVHILPNTVYHFKIPVGTTTVTLYPTGPSAIVSVAVGVQA